MSASLVGSEMCIRDRASTVSFDRAGVRDRPLSSRAAAAGAARGGGLNPVSYTHLTLPTICSV
eukprot:13831224-Alexandrium_andersonii.AAC.1